MYTTKEQGSQKTKIAKHGRIRTWHTGILEQAVQSGLTEQGLRGNLLPALRLLLPGYERLLRTDLHGEGRIQGQGSEMAEGPLEG